MKIQAAEFLMKRPALFWSLIVGILIAGVLSFIVMPKLEDPAIGVKQVMVMIPYQGATAHEVELKVAQPMEDEIRTQSDIKTITTKCEPGLATLTIEFAPTVLNKDLEQHFDQLRRKVQACQSKLPQGCNSPIVIDDMIDVYGIFYSLSGDGYSLKEMNEYAKKIQRELLSVKGVRRVNISGNRSEVINIKLSKEKIARNGLIPTQIMSELQNAGNNINAGKYKDGNDKLQMRISNAVNDVDEIRNMQIRTTDGKDIRLGNIANVERELSDPQRNGFFVNGKPSLAICVSMASDAIVPDVGKAVDAKLAEVMKDVPVGMHTEKIFFQPDKVNDAINSFMVNLVESVLIVIVVLIFAMGFRSGLIIGSGLVLAIAVSFPILLSMGTTLHRISLGAFIVAMGMLVDNAIVIMDGILVDRKRGYGPKTYLFRTGNSTALPLLGATVIAISTFVCVYLSPDTTGEYAKDLFLVLCVSLMASWVLALVQVPIFAKTMIPVKDKSAKKGTGTSSVMNSPLHQFVRKAINKLVEHRYLTMGSAVLVLLVCLSGMKNVKNLFFPDFDYKQFIIEYQMPAQTDPDKLRNDLQKISTLLLQNKKIERVTASMGGPVARYCLVRPINNGGDSYGELLVDCKDFATVREITPAVRKELREKYPDAYIRLRRYNFSIKTSHTVEVEFSGPDPAVLKRLSQQAENIMRKSPYVDSYSVENNWKAEGKALTVDYDREDGLRSGIERKDIGNALQAATDGLVVGVINDKEDQILINLKIRNNDGSKIKNLNDIPVWSSLNLHTNEADLKGILNGTSNLEKIQDQMFTAVPLSSVAHGVKVNWEEEALMRQNGQRAIEAECDPNIDLYEGTPAKLQASIADEINKIVVPEGYHMKWKGEAEFSGDAINSLLKYFPISIFIILAILLLLFDNWKKVVLVLSSFPFVLCGIIPTLLLFKQPFSFMAIIGFMGLVGMMIKNSIVLIDEINHLQNEEHMDGYNSVVEATVSRVRPVIMASLTTILGMLPLLGDPMYGSMAICIMSGLTVGTLITLILLPIFYMTFFHIRKPEKSIQ